VRRKRLPHVCRIPLELYPGRELEIVFWVESSYGDETQRYEAWARAEAVPWPDGPVDAYWQVDVLSTQWTGPQTASSAEDADHAHGSGPQTASSAEDADHAHGSAPPPALEAAGARIGSPGHTGWRWPAPWSRPESARGPSPRSSRVRLSRRPAQ